MILSRFLRFVFHLLYNQFAWTYDAVSTLVSAGLWARWVNSVVPELSGAERILEVGHGPGHLLESLYAGGRRPVGIDLSPQMGRQARRNLLRAGYEPALVRADARRLPFPDRSFDAVVATFPAEYIAEPETWRSFRRILAADGRILVLLGALPVGNHPLRLASRLLFRLTGQSGRGEAARLRGRLTGYIAESGLVGEYKTSLVGHSETYFFCARADG